MSQSVFCIVPTTAKANEIIGNLEIAGIGKADISVLLPDRSGTRDFAHEAHTKLPEGTAVGAASGGVVGGALGLLAGIGLLAIPGLGPFIAAGPIMAALSGMAVGATIGGVTGALIGLGMPELEAKRYEGKLKEGNVLISAHASSADDVKRVKNVFERAGATDISVSSETPVASR
ncbi:MAG: hypothetical protein SGJ09_04495 [Phycisphaerae bacterium]|nr:hypothetical protein [Phycisphaerae bacterium]